MKSTFVIAVLLVAVLVGWRLYVRSTTVTTPGIAQIHLATGRPVRTATVERHNLIRTVSLTGQLEALIRVPAQFDIDGRLFRITKDVGDRVVEGEEIAFLVDRDERSRFEAASAQVAMAQATLDKAVAGARPQELATARARLAEAQASFTLAKEEKARCLKLVKQRAASQQQLDQATSAFDAANARLVQARQGLALLEAGTRHEDLAAARAQLALATAQRESARLALAKTVLKAPTGGVIVSRNAEPGEVIKSMPEPRKIVEIEVHDPILFTCQVSELFIPALTRTTTATVTIDALPGQTFTASVHEISPSGDSATRTFPVEFAIANPGHHLRPGMFGRTKLTLRRADDSLTIPAFVLRHPDSLEVREGAPVHCLPQELSPSSAGERAIVMVASAGLAAARLVCVDFEANGMAAINEGLNEGDRIIIEGFEEISAGTKLATPTAKKEGLR